MSKQTEPSFGKSSNSPPSFFGRIPTRVVWDVKRPKSRGKGKGLTLGDFHIFTVLCSYANGQGFTWPNSQTIGDLVGTSRKNITRALTKCEKLGYIQKVSKYRSHPKWRHVMGTVWRVVYDPRLNQEELIDSMNHDDPAPVLEEDLPSVENEASKQTEEVEEDRLADALVVARWYVRAAEEATGEIRLVNPRAVELAVECLATRGLTIEQVKTRATAVLAECRNNRKSAPPHLGFLRD